MATPNQNTDKTATGRKPQDTKIGTRIDSDFDKKNMDQRVRQTETDRSTDARRADMPSTSDDVSSQSRTAGAAGRDTSSTSQKADWNRSEDSEELNVYGQDHNLDQDDDYQSDTRNEDDSLRKPTPEKFPGSAQDPKKMRADSDMDSNDLDQKSSRSTGSTQNPKAPSKKDDFQH